MILIRRYLARAITGAVVFVLAGFLGLFAFFDFVNELDDLGRGVYQLQHAVAVVLLGLPSRIYELMPVAALIGAIYALAQFAASSEFTAMRAAGLGRRRALAAVVTVGGGFALVTALVGELAAPPADRLARQIRFSALSAGTGAGAGAELRSGLWVKDTLRDEAGQVTRQRFVNIAEMRADTSLRAVHVFEFDDQFRLLALIDAAGARFEAPGRWRLQQVTLTRFQPVQAAGEIAALRAVRSTAADMVWESELSPELLGVLALMPERMSALALFQYIRHLEDNQQRSDLYQIALWKKLLYPLAVIVMLVLALPFAYLQVRAGGIGLRVFAGIMLGVAFHFMNGLFSHLGLLNTWPPWLATGMPSLFALALGLGMLVWADRAR
jgi:lipopolysaccharide export system permease protein